MSTSDGNALTEATKKALFWKDMYEKSNVQGVKEVKQLQRRSEARRAEAYSYRCRLETYNNASFVQKLVMLMTGERL